MQLNLLVLRCKNIEASKNFYEKLGLKFIKEQHGKSPVHYAALVGQMVMELYPLKDGYNIENSRLGFSLDVKDVESYLDEVSIEIISHYKFDDKSIVAVVDPDGRKIELKG